MVWDSGFNRGEESFVRGGVVIWFFGLNGGILGRGRVSMILLFEVRGS